MVTREGYDRLCEAMVDQGGSLEMRVLCCRGWLGRGRYGYSQRDLGSVGVLTIMSGECLGSAGSAGICWVVSGYVVMGSSTAISGNGLMGYDGVYRAWCGESPMVWECPTVQGCVECVDTWPGAGGH